MTQTPYAPAQQPQYTITEEDRKRQKKIAAAWVAYDGELDKPLQPMPGEPDDNVLENQCGPIVDGGMTFLFGKELEISVEEGAPDVAQKLINNTWGRKEKRIPLLQDLAINGALAGTAFLRIVPQRNKTYRLITIDPATVFVQTAPQDVETVLVYCIEYCTHEIVNGSPSAVYYREEISRNDPDQDGDDGDPFADVDATWTIQHWTRIGDRGNWTPAGDPIDWPYAFPPIFSCKNLPRPNSFWGKPDITPDIIGLNNALNLNESNINRLGKLTSAPIIYATGLGESEIAYRPGYITGLPTTESKIVAVNIAADTPNMLNFSENLRSNADELSGVPGIATGRLTAQPRGDMSGVAIELLFMPLLKKTEGKQCRYGELIIDVSKALLVLAGIAQNPEDIDITLTWANPLPSNDLPAVQTAVAKIGLGYSETTLIRQTGGDPDEEAALKEMEAQRTLNNFAQGKGMPPASQPLQGQAEQQNGPAPTEQQPATGGQ